MDQQISRRRRSRSLVMQIDRIAEEMDMVIFHFERFCRHFTELQAQLDRYVAALHDVPNAEAIKDKVLAELAALTVGRLSLDLSSPPKEKPECPGSRWLRETEANLVRAGLISRSDCLSGAAPAICSDDTGDAEQPPGRSVGEALSYTLRDAAALTGLSDDTLRRRAKEGRLRLVKVAGRTLVDGESLRALIRGAPSP